MQTHGLAIIAETLYKGEEYVEIMQELAFEGFQVSVLRGTGAVHRTKFRKAFTTREAADHALERHRIDALNEGFRFRLPDWQTG